MTKLYRHNNEWKMQAIGEQADGRTFHDLLPALRPACSSLEFHHGLAARPELSITQSAPRRPRSRYARLAASQHAVDLDSSAFALTAQGKVRGDGDFIFYNQTTLSGGGIQRAGDVRTFTSIFPRCRRPSNGSSSP